MYGFMRVSNDIPYQAVQELPMKHDIEKMIFDYLNDHHEVAHSIDAICKHVTSVVDLKTRQVCRRMVLEGALSLTREWQVALPCNLKEPADD